MLPREVLSSRRALSIAAAATFAAGALLLVRRRRRNRNKKASAAKKEGSSSLEANTNPSTFPVVARTTGAQTDGEPLHTASSSVGLSLAPPTYFPPLLAAAHVLGLPTEELSCPIQGCSIVVHAPTHTVASADSLGQLFGLTAAEADMTSTAAVKAYIEEWCPFTTRGDVVAVTECKTDSTSSSGEKEKESGDNATSDSSTAVRPEEVSQESSLRFPFMAMLKDGSCLFVRPEPQSAIVVLMLVTAKAQQDLTDSTVVHRVVCDVAEQFALCPTALSALRTRTAPSAPQSTVQVMGAFGRCALSPASAVVVAEVDASGVQLRERSKPNRSQSKAVATTALRLAPDAAPVETSVALPGHCAISIRPILTAPSQPSPTDDGSSARTTTVADHPHLLFSDAHGIMRLALVPGAEVDSGRLLPPGCAEQLVIALPLPSTTNASESAEADPSTVFVRTELYMSPPAAWVREEGLSDTERAEEYERNIRRAFLPQPGNASASAGMPSVTAIGSMDVSGVTSAHFEQAAEGRRCRTVLVPLGADRFGATGLLVIRWETAAALWQPSAKLFSWFADHINLSTRNVKKQ